MPSLPVSFSVLPSVFREEKLPPRQWYTNAPTLRFTHFKVYGCHPVRRRGTQALTGGDTGTPRFLATVPARMGSHWQRWSGKIRRLVSDFLNLLGVLGLPQRISL